jgi:hypothetical protein
MIPRAGVLAPYRVGCEEYVNVRTWDAGDGIATFRHSSAVDPTLPSIVDISGVELA